MWFIEGPGRVADRPGAPTASPRRSGSAPATRRHRRRRRRRSGSRRAARACVWRIEPGPQPESRSIDVGAGVTYVAFGDGAVWAANYVDGTVSRIDPRTNEVKQIPIGAVQSLAAGAGSAWVSTAGRPTAGTLPASVCGAVDSGGATPGRADRLGSPAPGRRRRRARARWPTRSASCCGTTASGPGSYMVGYRSCDDSTAQTGDFENRRCAANAQRVRARRAARGRDRPVELVLRRRWRSRSSTAPGRPARR